MKLVKEQINKEREDKKLKEEEERKLKQAAESATAEVSKQEDQKPDEKQK